MNGDAKMDICKNCRSYSRYGGDHEQHSGWCMKLRTTVGEKQSCAHYRQKPVKGYYEQECKQT